ncbi:MAG: biotin-dependent carboxyltransferase family protein [Oscillospiraceae bacterium]|jgi:biotin-dependent carboxylase-like uncharacterized protein|nr:biotin-dependent carboxyltransferase family protein [Oscillospiraceae bacterium]
MGFFTILQSGGLLSTVQDKGRFGFMASGFSPAGAMDLPAMECANLLVGQSSDVPVLEMTMTGVHLQTDCDCVIALTGADFAAKINDAPVQVYRALRLRAGDVLRCGAAVRGVRGYLAAAGGFAIEPVMGSCSTSVKFSLGGFEGRKLKAGDRLALRCPQLPVSRLDDRVLPVPAHLDKTRPAQNEHEVRAVLGPQNDRFSQSGIDTFLGSWYFVTTSSDRMGIKLDGAKIESKSGYDIISDGIVPGSVQVPASGRPIVMMADCQTTGGYTKIATVLSSDLHLLAQAKAGDWVRFAAVTSDEAARIARRHSAKSRRLEYAYLRV